MDQRELFAIPVEFGAAVFALVDFAPMVEEQRLQTLFADKATAFDKNLFRLEYCQQSNRSPDARQRVTILVTRVVLLDFDPHAIFVNIIGGLHAVRRGGESRGQRAEDR